jgi:hypothetical protein
MWCQLFLCRPPFIFIFPVDGVDVAARRASEISFVIYALRETHSWRRLRGGHVRATVRGDVASGWEPERGTGCGVGDDDLDLSWHQTSTYVLIIWTFLCLNRILPQISMENLILIQIQMYPRTYFLRTYFETGRILFPPTFNTCRRFNELRHILACILTKSAISIIGLNK